MNVREETHFYLIMLRAILLVLLASLLPGCDEEKAQKYTPEFSTEPYITQQQVYVFGIHPLHNPRRLHEVFGPLARYLGSKIPGARFKIEASRNYASFDKKLYGRKFHFALPNPFQTVNSLAHGYNVFGKMGDDDNFRGIFLVRKDSGIKKVADLRGRAVSFPAPTALAATMMPQYYLSQHGLDVKHDIEIRYVGSQESSIMNVMLGNVAAGATWPPPWRALSKERPELQRELKVIWQTESLPNNGLVVRDDIEPSLVLQVKALLLNLHENSEGREMLARMELSRFEAADNSTYQPVVEFLKKFEDNVRVIK